MQHNYLTSWNAFCLSCAGQFLEEKMEWKRNVRIANKSPELKGTCDMHDPWSAAK